jgi:hypothetical protein
MESTHQRGSGPPSRVWRQSNPGRLQINPRRSSTKPTSGSAYWVHVPLACVGRMRVGCAMPWSTSCTTIGSPARGQEDQ